MNHGIHSTYIKGDSQSSYSYAVDGDMEPPSCCYHHTCGTGIGKSTEIIDHYQVQNDTIMQWLRLSSHMKWFPLPFQTYKKLLTTFIYAVDGDMEPPSCCYHHTCGTQFGKSYQVTNETIMQWLRLSSHHGMVPTSTQSIQKGVDILHMLWMGVCSPPSCFYLHTCGTRFGMSAEIIDDFRETNDFIMHCLRL